MRKFYNKENLHSYRAAYFDLLHFKCSYSINVGEMESSQSSEVYEISQMLSTSASDFLDFKNNTASVRDDEGAMTVIQ
jgi:hypothetical protein